MNKNEFFKRLILYSSKNSFLSLSKSGSSLLIPKPKDVSFADPSDTLDLINEGSRLGNPCLVKMLFNESTKSGAVSTSVPSRSKRTALIFWFFSIHHVVNTKIIIKMSFMGERVIKHSFGFR